MVLTLVRSLSVTVVSTPLASCTTNESGSRRVTTPLIFIFWPDATVRELLVENGLHAAYTTIMTTLNRLHKKGFLNRVFDDRNRAFRYRPTQTQDEFLRSTLAADVEQWLKSASHPALPISLLVEAVTQHDAALLDELTRAVERKKQELRRREKN